MSPLLLAVGGWLAAAGVLARDCPDCVSRSWSCPKRCSPSNTRLHTFNFQYKETRCLDIIPWNGSSMQVDMNLWCAMPSTKRCRDFDFMCRSRITCYNMNRFTARGMISSLGFCPVPAEHSDLMSQNCDWVCKRGEPTIRCKYDFDRSGRFGIQSRLDTCWVQERCVSGQTQTLTTVCKPDGRASTSPHANVLGFATLLVTGPARFAAQSGVDNALGSALAQLVATSETHITMKIRRNGTWERNMLENTTQALHAMFNISVVGNASSDPLQRAIATKVLMEQVNSSQITQAMNSALMARGLEASVQAADLTVSPGLQNLTVQGPSRQEFYALVALLRKYKDYLNEVHADLQEAQSELSLQNLSTEEFASIKAKHNSAQQHMSEIMSSHAELSSEIENAIAKRNLTKHALAVAQSAAQSAAAELLRTQANLSSSQADLAALKQKQVAAEKDLLSALAVKESLNKQLKENTTRLGTSLEAVYEDLKYMRKLLVEARQANQSNYKELEDLEGDLLEEQANHNVTKFALALEREDHDMTKDELEEMTAEHSQIQWQLRSEKQQHRETKQDLHDEELLHLQTQAKLEEASKTASTMTLTFVLVTSCMSLLLVVLAAAFLVTFFRKRGVERLAVVADGSAGDNNIVVGRPVEPASRDAWVKTVEIGTKPGPTLLSCLGSPMKHPKSIGGATSACDGTFCTNPAGPMWLLLPFASITCLGQSGRQSTIARRSNTPSTAGPRALASLPSRKAGARLVLADSGGAEWWKEAGKGEWTQVQKASDPDLGSPFFSVAAELGTGVVAVGGGAGRTASIFGPNGSLLATLRGHTGWVRDLLFHDGHLFSIGCNFIKVWRRHGAGMRSASSWHHLGDLEVRGDLLALAVFGGFLVAAGASKHHNWFRLPVRELRPKDWLAEAQASLTESESPHAGRTTALVFGAERLLSCGHDGRVCAERMHSDDIFRSVSSDELPGGKLLCMALLEKGKVAVGSEEGLVHVLDAESLQATGSFRPFAPGSPVHALCALPGARVAAVSSSFAGFAVASPTENAIELVTKGFLGLPEGRSEVAWNLRVPANEPSGPWRSVFKERDPAVEGWLRSPADPRVRALRQHLESENCMSGLPEFSPSSAEFNVSRALESFQTNGFVVLDHALSKLQLEDLRKACSNIMDQIFASDPEGSFGGGAGKLPHRYSLGDSSRTKSNFHLQAYASLVDLETTTPLLMAIFGSHEYLAAGCGGDVVLAGAIEYQALHPDAIWGMLEKHVADYDIPPAVTVNFVLEDLTAINGPMRVVPGSHRWRHRPPTLREEPDWMMLNTLCPIKAGAAIFRDNRLWHGGTPNLSDRMRALPNMEYFPPGALPSLGWLDRHTMPWQIWRDLSPLAQYISRYVVAPPEESIPSVNEYSPAAILEIMPFLR
ncbi:unnamed protein product [Symbiodinium sp. CCMP2592]|nr:unnamed protein product [Symbiodinium sp. CCMP2592]